MGHGFTNAADSLAAIRRFVYQEHRITLQELVKALDADFVGYEDMQKMLLSGPKFGNDIDEVDELLVDVYRQISAAADAAGQREGLGFHTVSSVNPGGYGLGAGCGATADGRNKGKPFAIGHAPAAGRDTSGLTALFNSVAKADPANGGAATNFKISRELFTSSRPKLEAMFASYFADGGQEATLTVVNRNDLEAALKEPQNYGHVLVRLGGWVHVSSTSNARSRKRSSAGPCTDRRPGRSNGRSGGCVLAGPEVGRERQGLRRRGDGTADDSHAIQQALDDGGTVVVPAGKYVIGKTLLVGSGTRLLAHPQALIELANGAGKIWSDFLLANRNPEGGDADIEIAGGIWSGNNINNPRGQKLVDPGKYGGVMINFRNVARPPPQRLHVLRCPVLRICSLTRVSRFVIEKIRFHAQHPCNNNDGVHLAGYCNDGIIRHLRGLGRSAPNDDMVAMNADDALDRVEVYGGECGPIRDIHVYDIAADQCHNFVACSASSRPSRTSTSTRSAAVAMRPL